MKKFSDPSSGFTLAGEPGKQSQKVHRRRRTSPIQFLAQPHRQRTGEISPTAYFSGPSCCRSQRHHTDQLDSKWTIGSSAAPFLHLSFTNHHHYHKSLIVATIKLKQIAVSVRNDLAMSVVIENSQLVATESNLAPIGD